MPIDNLSARQKIWYRPILRLRYDTSTGADSGRCWKASASCSATTTAWCRTITACALKEIADDALLVEAYAYLDTTDYAEFLELAEGLNIRVLEIVAAGRHEPGPAGAEPAARTGHLTSGYCPPHSTE